MKQRLPWLLLIGVIGWWLIQRLGRRGGAWDREVHASLPGDEIIPHPMLETTHAITVKAPPPVVWKWLVQAGYRASGRAGWYSDRWFFLPFERAFLRLTVPNEILRQDEVRRSANEILPEYQLSAVGDIVPDGPLGSAYFVVKEVEPERFWVLFSDSHIRYLSPTALHGTALEAQGQFTWVFLLNPLGQDSTRLILRTRANLTPAIYRTLFLPFLYLSEAIIPRLILSGIKQRSENIQ